MRSRSPIRSTSSLALCALLLLTLPGCGDSGGSEGSTGPEAGESAAPLPCFLPGGKPVWRIRPQKVLPDGKTEWGVGSVDVTDFTIDRFAAQLALQRPGGSESYSRMRALEAAIMPQAVAYNLAGPKKVADASRRIRAVAERLRSGADFARVARESSDDLFSAKEGGNLDWVTRGVAGNKRAMTPSFEWVLFSTPVGKTSAPFASVYGFHVLHVHEERPSETALGHTDRRVSQILCAFDEAVMGNREFAATFMSRLRKAVRAQKVEILDPAWEAYVPGISRAR